MGDEGKTVNEIFTGYVLDNARTYAAALALYDEYKLSLSAEDKAKIKTDLEELADAAGGKTVMNGELVVANVTDHPRRVAFGRARYPTLWDYADGVDVMRFLTE